jgi:hypothetical protein
LLASSFERRQSILKIIAGGNLRFASNIERVTNARQRTRAVATMGIAGEPRGKSSNRIENGRPLSLFPAFLSRATFDARQPTSTRLCSCSYEHAMDTIICVTARAAQAGG